MKNKLCGMLLGLGISIIGAQVAHAQRLVIDNFKTGEHQTSLRNEEEVAYQSGAEILGGVRQTFFKVGPNNEFNQPTRLHIGARGSMIIDSGLKSFWGLFLGYGYDANGGLNPLNQNLKGYDRFRINFDSSDLEMGYLIQVYDGNGNRSTLSSTVSTVGRLTPFHADFPFADFPAGFPNAIDWNDIDFILVLFQSGSAIAGNDFAVRSIVALPSKQSDE
ncbi:MAG: hypothetical protein ACREAB_07610 [Blastocatellia bacterium]